MTTSVVTPTDWIDGVCERFSEISGWPLEFTRVEPATCASVQQELLERDDCCWFREINDGEETVGFLHFRLPESEAADHTFLAASEIAELLTETLNRWASASQTLSLRSRDLNTLVDIGLVLPREEDLVTALTQLLGAAVQLTGFRSTGFFLLDPKHDSLRLRLEHHLDSQVIPRPVRPLSDSPPDAAVLAEGTVVLHSHAHPEFESWVPQGIATAACLPVGTQHGPIGTLWAFDRRSRIPTDREIHVLESLSAQIATVLERVVLRKESETQRRLAHELRVVNDNQRGNERDQRHAGPGFEAAGRCQSRFELGGDLCEVIGLDERYTLLTIGDASGDSIPAAIVMTSVRGALRTIASGPLSEAIDTARAVERLNRALHAITPAHQFMSFFYGVLDTETMTLTYTNAGHPAPILVGSDRSLSHLTSHGMLLGVSDDAEYESSRVPLCCGDRLVMFTDGIVEAISPSDQMFRSDGIIAAIEANSDESAAGLLHAIWSEYELHAAGGSDPDDRSLLVVRMQ